MNVRIVRSSCEDFPCCGHGPPPMGDDGGCPVEYENVDTGETWQQWPCASCRAPLPTNSPSALCVGCLERSRDDSFWDQET